MIQIDYTNEAKFWYNRPANMTSWPAAGECSTVPSTEAIWKNPDLRRLYKLTVNGYTQRWDTDDDGLMEPAPGLIVPSIKRMENG